MSGFSLLLLHARLVSYLSVKPWPSTLDNSLLKWVRGHQTLPRNWHRAWLGDLGCLLNPHRKPKGWDRHIWVSEDGSDLGSNTISNISTTLNSCFHLPGVPCGWGFALWAFSIGSIATGMLN